MNLLQADRQEWAAHPVTQAFLKTLRESRQETLESWAKEAYIGETAEQSGHRNAKALGGVNVLDQVIELIEDHAKEDSDD